ANNDKQTIMSGLQRLHYFKNNTLWSLENFLYWSLFYTHNFGSKDNEYRIYKMYLENIHKDPDLIKSCDNETVQKSAEEALEKFTNEINSAQINDLWRKCLSFIETLKKAIDLNADKIAFQVNDSSEKKEVQRDTILNKSIKIIDDSDSDTESINGDKGEEEIKMLIQDEIDIRNKLLKILTYLVRPLPTIYMLQQFGCIKISATFGDFKQFSKDMIYLMDWQTDILSTARAINKAIMNFMKNNNNICITSVNDTSWKKESNKNQPLPKSPSPSFSSSGRDLMHHLDSSVHEKIDLNDLDNTLFKSKNSKN
ncbi:6209_t:CDS:2, partial [Ambispora leptoticha]